MPVFASVASLFSFSLPGKAQDEAFRTHQAESVFQKYSPPLRPDLSSIALPAGRKPLLTIPAVETFFNKPASVYGFSAHVTERLQSDTSFAGAIETASEILDFKLEEEEAHSALATISFPPSVPETLRPLLSSLTRHLSDAQSDLHAAVVSLPAADRSAFLALLEETEISHRKIRSTYESLLAFDQAALLRAARHFAQALDEAWTNFESPPEIPKPIVWTTPLGVIRIGSPEDDTYTEADLKNVVLLLEPGGRNSYSGPVAAAKAGEIRLVVDRGTDITVFASEKDESNAGSGVFGLAAMLMPNPEGMKRIVSPSYSQGCGIGGVGVLASNGPVQLDGRRFVQGVGGFGIGLLRVQNGHRSSYVANRGGQGLGLTKGIGLFLHHGNVSEVKGGLVEPDPREPLGTVSLCQGVGYGPRGYAGGGIGIASLRGSSMSVTGSYFAQGCGYWHSLGIFNLEGDRNSLQARRYDQGTGVHYAFGHFRLTGNNNNVVNWGVGPGFGWDRSLGSVLVSGDENTFQTEWGAGTAAIGSLSFGYWTGRNNKLLLTQLGAGGFFRDEISRSLHIIEGAGNRLLYGASSSSGSLVFQRDPWSQIVVAGGQTDSTLKLKDINWSGLTRITDDRSSVDLPFILEKAEGLPTAERVERWLDVAAAFSSDKATPRAALLKLIQIPPADLPHLIGLADPAAVDQMIPLRIALAAHGPDTADTVFRLLPELGEEKQAVALNSLDAGESSRIIPTLIKLLGSETDTRKKVRMTLILARLFSRDTGNEPGQRAILETLNAYYSGGKKDAATATLNSLLSRLFVHDAFALLSKTIGLANDQRAAYLKALPPDLTETIGPHAALIFMDLLAKDEALSIRSVNEEAAALEGLETQVREAIAKHFSSKETDLIQAALVGLGHIGNANDARQIGSFLTSNHPRLRESAAAALGRMGHAGLAVLERAYRRGNAEIKKLVLSALPLATADGAFVLIEKGLADRDVSVRRSAVSALLNLSPAVEKHRSKLVSAAHARVDKERDPGVRLALQAVGP